MRFYKRYISILSPYALPEFSFSSHYLHCGQYRFPLCCAIISSTLFSSTLLSATRFSLYVTMIIRRIFSSSFPFSNISISIPPFFASSPILDFIKSFETMADRRPLRLHNYLTNKRVMVCSATCHQQYSQSSSVSFLSVQLVLSTHFIHSTDFLELAKFFSLFVLRTGLSFLPHTDVGVAYFFPLFLLSPFTRWFIHAWFQFWC